MADELEKYNDYLKKCFKEDPPPCRCSCPFKLDVRSFTAKVSRGRFDSAFREYRNAVLFPEIVSRVCEAPCESVCVRLENDGSAVSLKGIEAACIAFSKDRKTVRYDLPVKPDRIAVIGGGLSGLACALKLASRNFPVTIFFAEAETGGSLADSSAADVYRAEIDAELAGLPIEYRPNTVVTEIGSVLDEGFRAVYIATGKGGETFGALDGYDKNSLGSRMPGVFIGGEVLGVSPVQAIEHGSRASRSIDKYLQLGAMDGIPETYEIWPVNELYYRAIPKAPPFGTDEKDGAVSEAGRCTDCECSECIDVCPILKSARRTPKKLAADVSVTINKIEQQTRRIANRLINACNLCGLCAEVCPAEVEIGDCMLTARKTLVDQGGMPPVFHDYYLRDLDHALSDEAYFEHASGKYLFFPGCQTGASYPNYILKPYEAMLEKEGKAGILVTCCGAPAEWAGDEARADELMQRIKDVWDRAGRPTLVCSCITCRNKIAESLPEIPVVTYFEWLDRAGVDCFGTSSLAMTGGEESLTSEKISSSLRASEAKRGNPYYIFDPCAARYSGESAEAVRNILTKNGSTFTDSGTIKKCCGYGGHIYASNPGLYDEIVKDRVTESDDPYLVYCSNCRDAFAAQGKSCRHVYDVLFGTGDDTRPAPKIAERRQNRRVVKRRLEKLIKGEKLDEEKPGSPQLIVSDDIAAKMERELISADDARNIVREAEDTKVKLFDAESGSYIAHGAVGVYTCWVVYVEEDSAFRLTDIYTHRLHATEEA